MTTEAQPRAKNGAPAHSTTGVGERELDPARERPRGEELADAETSPRPSIRAAAAPTAPRRSRSAGVKSTSSGLGASSAAASSGSSAMPQIGQLPGPLRRICGCIGQVQIVSNAVDAG